MGYGAVFFFLFFRFAEQNCPSLSTQTLSDLYGQVIVRGLENPQAPLWMLDLVKYLGKLPLNKIYIFFVHQKYLFIYFNGCFFFV